MKTNQRILDAFAFRRRESWLRAFFDFNTSAFERLFVTKGENFWQSAGERRALSFFKRAAEEVPAYRDFLKKNRVRHEKVRTISDFALVPTTDKENYIKKYPIEKRCWGGELPREILVAASSGTSGEPSFWPRGGYQEYEQAIVHEILYRALFGIHRRRTLLIVGFPMGVYVSGVATLLPSILVSEKGYSLTIASVGNDKKNVLRVISSLYGNYDQVVLAGHSFFVKDVIETGKAEGVPWQDMRLGMFFCSEGFSEEWREYVLKQAGTDARAFSTYGSSELLLMAYETSFTIAVRKKAEEDAVARSALFGDEPELPAVFQYNPFLRYIEPLQDGELLFTASSGGPLIRYNLKDRGKIIFFSDAERTLGKADGARGKWRLPLVALWGRNDQTVIFYAANIYPKHIRIALDWKPFFRKLTGKFTIRKGCLKNMDEFLEINIELQKGIQATQSLAAFIQKRAVKCLREVNMEYLDASSRLSGKDLRPRITLWPYSHEKYFKPSLKSKYIVKETR